VNRLAIVAVLALASTAAAERKVAERYFRAGAKAYAAQNFVAAAANFDEAYKSEAMPEIAFSAAQAYRRLYRIEPKAQHVVRAIELYRDYLAKVKTGGRVGDAADNLAEMERELDKLGASGVRVGSSSSLVSDAL
jgi:tetratricopeptide (TPR) repeat protein